MKRKLETGLYRRRRRKENEKISARDLILKILRARNLDKGSWRLSSKAGCSGFGKGMGNYDERG